MWAQGLDFAQTPQGGDFLRARGVQWVAGIEGFTVVRANIKPLHQGSTMLCDQWWDFIRLTQSEMFGQIRHDEPCLTVFAQVLCHAG